MQAACSAYISKVSPIHSCDARTKVLLLFASTVALLCARSWTGMALFVCAVVLVIAASRLPAGRMLSMLGPLYAILAFTVLFGSLAGAGGETTVPAYGPGKLALSGLAPIALSGQLAISPAGFETAVFNALRILCMALLSLVVSLSTTSNDLTEAVRSLLSPLRKAHVPVDDVTTTLSLAVRFIPVFSEELERTKDAQLSRAARLSTGGFLARILAWSRVLAPLFVGVFRRAERLAVAMDARCYGARRRRTSLQSRSYCLRDGAVLAVGIAFCAVCALA